MSQADACLLAPFFTRDHAYCRGKEKTFCGRKIGQIFHTRPKIDLLLGPTPLAGLKNSLVHPFEERLRLAQRFYFPRHGILPVGEILNQEVTVVV